MPAPSDSHDLAAPPLPTLPSGPRVVRSPAHLSADCDRARAAGHSVGFVPTMGALHAGHLALVQEAKRKATFVVVSIFVNPTQFGPKEDWAKYPRDLESDVSKLGPLGVACVLAPSAADMYLPGGDTRVHVGALSQPLEGAIRPGHFEGVATVVAKLLGIVGPCAALFGRKDYQQLLVVRRMVRDLFLPVEVIAHPIVREADGLAMSSRNAYLSVDERQRALSIVHGLDRAARAFARGERDARQLERATREALEGQVTSVDYVSVCDEETLTPVSEVASRAVLAVACRVGTTRLIDNILLGNDPPPLA